MPQTSDMREPCTYSLPLQVVSIAKELKSEGKSSVGLYGRTSLCHPSYPPVN